VHQQMSYYIDIQYEEIMSDIDPEAVYLSEGSGRVVFINHDLSVVYKVAKSQQGIYQNKQEYLCSKNYPDVVPNVHEALTINNQDYVVLTVDVTYDYEQFMGDANNDIQTFIATTAPHADIETTQDMRDILAIYPINELHPSDPKRLYLTQLQEYVDGIDDAIINYDDVEEIVTSDLILLLEEAHPNTPFQYIITVNEVNTKNIGFKPLPDGSFVPQVIDAGIDDWDKFKQFQQQSNTEAPIKYY